MKNENVAKSITPEVLQELFLDYARELCVEEIEFYACIEVCRRL